MAAWHIITSEYPPQAGGVSDYTHLVAHGLAAAGDEVHVWCPAAEETASATNVAEVESPDAARVFVHREFGNFTPGDLRNVDELLEQFSAPRRLLVQWVPHGYGYRSMNVAFCLWLRRRAFKYHDVVDLMVHEPFLGFGEGSWRQSGVAAIHRVMTMVLLSAARRVWISIPAWEKRLRPYALGRALPFQWLPVASNIPVVDDPAAVTIIRKRYAPTGMDLVGHFGTYDRHITGLLLQSVPALLRARPNCAILLLGRGSEPLCAQLRGDHPELAARVFAPGTLPAAKLSLHLSACDVLLQPYVDGVSSRRTSVMVGLSHGVPIVTTSGKLTEPLWAESEAVALVALVFGPDASALVEAAARLLVQPTLRERLRVASRALYAERFEVKLIIDALRGATSDVG